MVFMDDWRKKAEIEDREGCEARHNLEHAPLEYDKPAAPIDTTLDTDNLIELATAGIPRLMRRAIKLAEVSDSLPAITSLVKELSDRAYGKAAQMVQIDSKQTITHEHVISMAPEEAYKQLIAGDYEIIEIEEKQT